MNLREEAPGLCQLLHQQFEEARIDLESRLDRMWRNFRQYRGLYSYQDEETERTGYHSQANEFFEDSESTLFEENQTETTPNTYDRETFRQAETLLAVLDEAYLLPEKPFDLVLPKILKKPPAFDEIMSRKDQLDFMTSWVQDLYAKSGKEQTRLSFNCCVVLGTGIDRTLGTEDGAEVRAVMPWRFYCDPLPEGGSIQNARYAAEDFRYTVGEAIGMWPDQADEIRQAAVGDDKDGADMERDKEILRKEVHVYEFFGRYDLEAIEAAYDEGEDGQDAGQPQQYCLRMLGNAKGLTDTLLGEPVLQEIQKPGVPFSVYAFKKSLSEKGIWGLSLPEMMEEDQHLLNDLTNALRVASTLCGQLGCLYDSLLDNGLEVPLREGFEPGDMRPINVGPMRGIKDSILPVSDLFNPAALAILEKQLAMARLAPQRTLGITDQISSGIPINTNSDTAEEANLLNAASNRRLRLYAANLDVGFKRTLLLLSLNAAAALKRGLRIWYWDEAKQKAGELAGEAFDEEWEVKLRAGSAWISDRQKVRDLGMLATMAARTQAPEESRMLVRRVALLLGEDPDELAQLNPPMPTPPSAPEPEQIPLRVASPQGALQAAAGLLPNGETP